MAAEEWLESEDDAEHMWSNHNLTRRVVSGKSFINIEEHVWCQNHVGCR